MANDTEYTVHFQKGFRVGTRSLHMEHVLAVNSSQAIEKAKVAFSQFRAKGFRIVRIDHVGENGHITID